MSTEQGGIYQDQSGIVPLSEYREALTPPEIGIYDENDRLTRVALWGPVGAEAVLAQIYPKDLSLFYDRMDVEVAREEAQGFANSLRQNGVEVHTMRDLLAQQILSPVEGVSRNQLISELAARAHGIFDHHYLPNGRERATGNFPIDEEGNPVAKSFFDYVGPISALVDTDIARYGLQRAVALNEALSVDPDMPLGNSIYARDQMNVILGTRFVSSMKKDIRKKEVPLFEILYAHIGIGKGVEMPDGETFEGGDAYVHDGIVYVGVGSRTSEGAAEHIFRVLKQNGQLDQAGFRFVMVKDKHQASKTDEQLQQFMHLDTFSNPIGPGQMVVCEAETDNRHAIEFMINPEGKLVTVDHGRFVDFLKGQGNIVSPVPIEAQKEFACNFLAVDGQTIFMADTQDEANSKVSKMLEGLGKTVVRIPLRESTRGYGASHCMTGQLRRE